MPICTEMAQQMAEVESRASGYGNTLTCEDNHSGRGDGQRDLQMPKKAVEL